MKRLRVHAVDQDSIEIVLAGEVLYVGAERLPGLPVEHRDAICLLAPFRAHRCELPQVALRDIVLLHGAIPARSHRRTRTNSPTALGLPRLSANYRPFAGRNPWRCAETSPRVGDCL